MRAYSLRICLLLLLISASSSFAYYRSKTSPLGELLQYRVQVDYYQIRGRTIDELRRQISLYGPIDKQGVRRDAETKWRISWRWPHKPVPEIHKVRSSYSASVTLPAWVDYAKAPASIQKQWDEYFAALVRHELQHVQHAAHNYARVERIIQDRLRHTGLSEQQANALARKEIQKIRRQDYEYDRRTEHGMLEGVALREQG